jgi:hypothetical protein
LALPARHRHEVVSAIASFPEPVIELEKAV